MDFQDFLKDLLTIDCAIETKLQELQVCSKREKLDLISNDIKEELRNYKEKLKEMKEFCDLLLASNDKKDIYSKELEVQRDHLNRKESTYRNRYLESNRRIDKQERNDLFDNINDNSSVKIRQRFVDKETILKQARLNTDSLHELNNTLRSSLAHSNDTLNSLITSSNSINNINDEFKSMNVNISDGKRLINKYDQRDLTYKAVLLFSLLFFFSVVLNIIWKRAF